MSDFIMTLDSDEEPQALAVDSSDGEQDFAPIPKTGKRQKVKSFVPDGPAKAAAKKSSKPDSDDFGIRKSFHFDGLGGNTANLDSPSIEDGDSSNVGLTQRRTIDDIVRDRKAAKISEQRDDGDEIDGRDSEKDESDEDDAYVESEASSSHGVDSSDDSGSSDEYDDARSKNDSDDGNSVDVVLGKDEQEDGPQGATDEAKSFFSERIEETSDKKKSSFKAESFSNLPGSSLSRTVLLGLSSLGLSMPTPIQRKCIPVALLGKDIVANSATGSGKTVAFWVGAIERLLHRDRSSPRTRMVVLTPTRELATQVFTVGRNLARYTDIQFSLCVGGMSLKAQEAELKLRPDVVVSTPGRLIDHVRNTPSFTIDFIEILVLDEADRMLEEGFRAELEEILLATPKSRQTLLFSATITESIAQLSRLSMLHPVRVKVDELGAAAKNLVQEFVRVRGDKSNEAIERTRRSGEPMREALLVAVCTKLYSSGRTIIFFRSKAQAHRMKVIFSLLGNGLERSDELHGDLTQESRNRSLQRFRDGACLFLLATDLASRGLDIKGVQHVVNYEMPASVDIYIHRIGRTARAGESGRSLTLVGEADRKLVKQAMKSSPPDLIRQQVFDPKLVSSLSKNIRGLEDEIKQVFEEEHQDKQMRQMESEIKRGENLIKHEAEIKSRPARTWFQSEKDKKAASASSKDAYNEKFANPIKRSPTDGMSRRKRRRREMLEEEDADALKQARATARAAKKTARDNPGAAHKKKKKGKKN